VEVSGANYIGRVAGSASDVSLTNNIANSTMNDTSWTSNANGKDGADVTLPVNQSNFQSTLGWNFSTVWTWQGSYPVLQGQP
jgi:hypothetical protein